MYIYIYVCIYIYIHIIFLYTDMVSFNSGFRSEKNNLYLFSLSCMWFWAVILKLRFGKFQSL